MTTAMSETKPQKAERKRSSDSGPKVEGGSPDARRIAAAILEVLAGIRTPSDAAVAVGVSLPRYYALETRAIEGLVKSCETRPKGRTASPEKETVTLKKRLALVERELARKQALLRTQQRAVGLLQPTPPTGKRKRRAVVRALKAAQVLRSVTEPMEVKSEEAQT